MDSVPGKEIVEASDNGKARPGGGGLPIPKLPIWIRLALGGILFFMLPTVKRVLTIEDGVEKVVKTAAEAVEKVAEVTEKMALDVASALPDNKLKQELLMIEHIAEVIDKAAKRVEEFVRKVDHAKEQVEQKIGVVRH